MKTILIPVDYSPNSKSALLYALKMAHKADLKVVVFHSFYYMVSPPAAYDIPSFIPDLEREKSKELEQYVRETRDALQEDVVITYKHLKNDVQRVNAKPAQLRSVFHTSQVSRTHRDNYPAHVTCVAKLGSVYDQIMIAAEAYGADMIVMGMQGKGALGQAVIGSTTISVMRNSRVPVLGVPLNMMFNDSETVVFASDLRQQPNKLMLNKLRDYVRTFCPKLEVLHIDKEHDLKAVQQKAKDALEIIDRQLYDLDYKVILQQRVDVAAGIQAYVQEHRADLLVLGPQKHSLLEKLLNKSVTSRIVANSVCPLLALPVPKTGNQDIAAEELEHVRD
ncbi:hypothetical protein GCM10023188_30540 [Pontibacter saemangeumensis]|uniref:UspA domain-containing protein n=1 Tax=Pontibacter saemangeumensis TaxID=1084525 RepID=A0ABP8LVQ4_9BACT